MKGFTRFCNDPEIACCKAEKELISLEAENEQLKQAIGVIPLERVAEICRAEEELRLIELPCETGSFVYVRNEQGGFYECYVSPLQKIVASTKPILTAKATLSDCSTFTAYIAQCNEGETWFLTEAEAQAALEKMGGK